MHRFRTMLVGLCLGFAAPLTGLDSLVASDLPPPFCRTALHEETLQLENARLEVDLARSGFEAYGEIFELIEGLREAEAIQRMIWLEAKYDYDSARLALERADLQLERQAALVEQYRLLCSAPKAGAGETAVPPTRDLDSAYRRYRRADCDQQAKAIEVATVDLTFSREFLASIRELRSGEVATRQQVILAELDVALGEKRLADARRRTTACRRESPAREGSLPR